MNVRGVVAASVRGDHMRRARKPPPSRISIVTLARRAVVLVTIPPARRTFPRRTRAGRAAARSVSAGRGGELVAGSGRYARTSCLKSPPSSSALSESATLPSIGAGFVMPSPSASQAHVAPGTAWPNSSATIPASR